MASTWIHVLMWRPIYPPPSPCSPPSFVAASVHKDFHAKTAYLAATLKATKTGTKH